MAYGFHTWVLAGVTGSDYHGYRPSWMPSSHSLWKEFLPYTSHWNSSSASCDACVPCLSISGCFCLRPFCWSCWSQPTLRRFLVLLCSCYVCGRPQRHESLLLYQYAIWQTRHWKWCQVCSYLPFLRCLLLIRASLSSSCCILQSAVAVFLEADTRPCLRYLSWGIAAPLHPASCWLAPFRSETGCSNLLAGAVVDWVVTSTSTVL